MPDKRVMDLAWMRHKDIIYTGETLVLALLLHTQGAGRGSADHEQVRRMLNDPNAAPVVKSKRQTNRKPRKRTDKVS